MKISRIVIALSGAFSGTFAFECQAQSAVTFYGTIDAGIRSLTNVNAAGNRLVKLSSNGEFYNNRIGFKGDEDLGGGVRAHFLLESGWNTGTGELDNWQNKLFNRYSLVGLEGPFGVVDFGRMPSLSCKIISFYDPFQYHYVHTIPLAGATAGHPDGNLPGNPFGTMGGTRFNNDVQYIGKVGSLLFGAEYAFGETNGVVKDGKAQAIAIGYNTETFMIGGGYTRQKPNVAAFGPAIYRDQDQITFGGAYRIGNIRFSGGYIRTSTDDGIAPIRHQMKNIWAGASYDVTSTIAVTLGYYRTTLESDGYELARRNFAILGTTYALSKRTTLYAALDHAELSGIATLPTEGQTSQIGISTGISHSF
ncbi:MAG TPA: porin [Oxalicibacterium sp.]|uniref:porin n=1 Tax=Oxalicibacterium sp. TaxID=2766525 RepID=UPI002CB28CBA|nr:porin [Oxalicibacterium sp.]HWU98867.1 porin [Oxalicibacterium sp.]